MKQTSNKLDVMTNEKGYSPIMQYILEVISASMPFVSPRDYER